MVPPSPARMRGPPTATLLHLGEQFRLLVADVPSELDPRRTGAREPPILHRADGHAEEIGDLTLGEEGGCEGRQEVHTAQECLPPGASGNARHSPARQPRNKVCDGVSGDQSGKTAPSGLSYGVGGRAVSPRNLAILIAGAPRLGPRTTDSSSEESVVRATLLWLPPRRPEHQHPRHPPESAQLR